PSLLSDENVFFKNFVNQELLSTLGFIVTITLATAASLHLELNKLEDQTGNAFPRTRASVKKSAYSLMFLLGFALILVVVKPMLPKSNESGVALAYSIAVLLFYFSLFVLYALTRTIFGIPTAKKINEGRK
ncbi:MAG: hypothetical protein ABW203_04455, partial [Novosphingobium sp.]